ncbi:MAG: ion transporter [Ignavibacteria bacterium]|nr:ion transporter [Ignavibacteria bacterium]
MEHRKHLAKFLDGNKVQSFITGLIFINAITLGLETSASIRSSVGIYLQMFDNFVILVFATEISLKLYANGLKFFKSGWNLFDFTIVLISLIPSTGSLSVLRALRVLRILRLLKMAPRLKFIVNSLFKSLPDLIWIFILILIFYYLYSVMGTKLFGESFPELFGTLPTSMFTLFQLMTLEDWANGVAKPVMSVFPYAYIYFISFILITSVVVLNLIIAVIVSGLEAIQTEERKILMDELEKDIESDKREILTELRSLKNKLSDIENSILNSSVTKKS